MIERIRPKLIVSYNYIHMVPKDVIEMMPNKIVNLHISFLPYNRGFAPNIWSFWENTKKGVYRIVNPMVKFYFTFIYPNECAIHNMDEEEFYQTYIADYLDAYCMLTFPAICEEFLILANERDMLPIHFTKYGQWVGKSGTIDLIAQNKERDFLFSFCKPSRGELTYDEFLDRLSTTKETHLVPDYFAVFSLDGFDSKFLDDFSERENVYLFDREDLC